jgi:hypothetical protein
MPSSRVPIEAAYQIKGDFKNLPFHRSKIMKWLKIILIAAAIDAGFP